MATSDVVKRLVRPGRSPRFEATYVHVAIIVDIFYIANHPLVSPHPGEERPFCLNDLITPSRRKAGKTTGSVLSCVRVSVFFNPNVDSSVNTPSGTTHYSGNRKVSHRKCGASLASAHRNTDTYRFHDHYNRVFVR